MVSRFAASKHRANGFTIVELLIVIVVIAILAAVTVTSYSGIQTRAKNTARVAEARAWQKHLEMYRAIYGDYPSVPDGGYCLGTGFPSGRCRDIYDGANPAYVYHEADSVVLMTELEKAGPLPIATPLPTGGYAGPYVSVYAWGYELYIWLEGDESVCEESGFTYSWDYESKQTQCIVFLPRD